MRLGSGTIHGDLAPFARRLGAGTGREKTSDVEPDVEANRWERHAIPGGFFLSAHRASVSAEGATAGVSEAALRAESQAENSGDA